MILRLCPTQPLPAAAALVAAYDALVEANRMLAQATGEDLCVRATEQYAIALEHIADTQARSTSDLVLQARALLLSADWDKEGSLLAVDEDVAATLAHGVLRLLGQEQRA